MTNGVKELIYRSGEEEIIKSVMPSNSVKDVTGAGDSFCAAVVYSWLNGMSTEDILIAGMVNAKKTIETKYTVRAKPRSTATLSRYGGIIKWQIYKSILSILEKFSKHGRTINRL